MQDNISRIAFVFNRAIKIPSNYREYYISRVLLSRGYKVKWFFTCNTENQGFYKEFFSCKILNEKKVPKLLKYLFYPLYIAVVLKIHGIKMLWISGWNERSHTYLRLYVKLLKIFSIKLVYDPVDPIYEYKTASGVVKRPKKLKSCMNSIYRSVDLVLVPTEELRKLLIYNGAPQDKIKVTWFGTNLEVFHSLKKERPHELDFLSQKFVIGWLGHMSPFKGIEDILIPLIKTIHKKIPESYFLIGGEGILEPELKLLEEKEHLPITLFGKVDYQDAPLFTELIDLYVVPIDDKKEMARAIRPIKIFDALSLAVPIVTTGTEATLFLKKEFRSISFAENNLESFSEKLVSAYLNYEELKQYAREDQKIVKRYDNRVIAEKIVDCLEKSVVENNAKRDKNLGDV
ncbi:hypothetical protein B4O97_15900 [Marispirochaeta aestuarii]|uniref:Glycosyl transferase family 1 domain-containing protein n=1 Tax=Marispirochaeta aestuarii TaxID=1963862 RepID=A0A1Y1RUD3_9SPIO|nr:glycosyltransferase [Marispirochaeta aestuarii]ORC32641.1 hypothetical protein B4O97_15900 [Marispirochaeta aestuarii]